MSVRVVDASALGALMFEEHDSGPLTEVLTGTLAAPTIIRYELAQVCRTKLTRQPEALAVLRNQYSLLDRFDLQYHEPDWANLPEFALSWRLSVYDAAYLQLALALDAPLITLDVRLFNVWRDAVA